ncbi:MAG: hypothetical protein AB7W59_01230 [Acidimicrobiia bacterium]
MVPRITVLIDLPATQRFHRSTVDALQHAIDEGGHDAVISVLRTDAPGELGDAVVVGPGSPYRDPGVADHVIRTARERGLPLLGT